MIHTMAFADGIDAIDMVLRDIVHPGTRYEIRPSPYGTTVLHLLYTTDTAKYGLNVGLDQWDISQFGAEHWDTRPFRANFYAEGAEKPLEIPMDTIRRRGKLRERILEHLILHITRDPNGMVFLSDEVVREYLERRIQPVGHAVGSTAHL